MAKWINARNADNVVCTASGIYVFFSCDSGPQKMHRLMPTMVIVNKLPGPSRFYLASDSLKEVKDTDLLTASPGSRYGC